MIRQNNPMHCHITWNVLLAGLPRGTNRNDRIPIEKQQKNPTMQITCQLKTLSVQFKPPRKLSSVLVESAHEQALIKAAPIAMTATTAKADCTKDTFFIGGGESDDAIVND